MPVQAKRPKPCPYKLPPFPPLQPETLKILDPSHVLEFFRIEALLRSATVMQLYSERKAESPDESAKLYSRYWITWNVLSGAHHVYLDPQRQKPRGSEIGQLLGPGITDVSGWLDGSETGLVASPECLYIEIDSTVRPRAVLDALGPILQQRYKRWGKKTPEIRKVHEWFNYLRCYDLLASTPELSYGQIAEHVYGENNRQTYERAEMAIKRVARLIAAAEHRRWPPRQL